MATNKKTNPLKKQQKITIIFGYSLFLSLILALVTSFILPWSDVIFNTTDNNIQSLLFAAILIAGALLPTLTSYFIGDKSGATNHTQHHYNGILFGVLAYWVALLAGLAGSIVIYTLSDFTTPVHRALGLNLTIIMTAITASVLLSVGFSHRSNKSTTLLGYAPFYVALSLTSLAATLPYLGSFADILSFIPLLMLVMFTALSYKAFQGLYGSQVKRLASALVAASFGFVAIQSCSQLLASYSPPTRPSWVELTAIAVGALVWATYTVLLRRAK